MERREGFMEGTTIETEPGGREEGAAEKAKEKARELGSRASARAEAVTTRLGGRMKEMGTRLRGRSAGQEGRKAQLMEKTAGRFDRMGDYLEHHKPDEISRDLASAIRRHPARAVAVGVGLGYLVARLFRRPR